MEEGTSREILAMVSASVTRVRGGSGNRKVKMNGQAINQYIYIYRRHCLSSSREDRVYPNNADHFYSNILCSKPLN